MFMRNQTTLIQKTEVSFLARCFSILTIAMLLGFCANLVSADTTQTSRQKIRSKYDEIKTIANKPSTQNKPAVLEQLVEKSTNFIALFPQYKRVDEVYYYLGDALVKLGRVEQGIKVYEKLIKEQPKARWVEDSLFGLGSAYDILGQHDKADEVYKKLINHPEYGSRSFAKQAKKILEQDKASRKGGLPKPSVASSSPNEWIGKPAPDFQVTTLKSEKLSLKKHQGQVVLLDFWATWCPPCVAEIPNLKKTYEKYKDQKFQIIGISLDRSRQPLDAFIHEKQLAWKHYWDQGRKVSNQYNVRAIPLTFLIDGKGVIRKTNLRGPALETAVAELVKENIAKPAGTVTKSVPATKLIKPSSASQITETLQSSEAKMREWVGKPAPDFQVTTLKGEELSLKKYRGQVVLLDFWATWCGPCLEEMPKVKKTYEKYKDQKFQIIGISSDKSKPPLEAYVEKEGLGWIHTWDENRKLRNLYRIIGIPTAFLIDGEGVIRKASLGGFDVETAVAELVKENLAKPVDTSPIKTPAASPKASQNVDPKAKEIIDAAVAAHGGLEKLAAVKNIVVETRSFEHPDATIDHEGTSKLYLFSDKFRGDWCVNDQRFSLIFDGNSVYQINDGKIKQRSAEKAKSYANDYKNNDFRELIWPLTDLLKEDATVQYKGTEKVKDVPASVLLVTQPSGKKSKVFISQKTHYVVKLSYTGDLGGKAQDVVMYLDDYRDVSGIKIPHHRATKIFEHRETLITDIKMNITDIKLNVDVGEALFQPNASNE